MPFSLGIPSVDGPWSFVEPPLRDQDWERLAGVTDPRLRVTGRWTAERASGLREVLSLPGLKAVSLWLRTDAGFRLPHNPTLEVFDGHGAGITADLTVNPQLTAVSASQVMPNPDARLMSLRGIIMPSERAMRRLAEQLPTQLRHFALTTKAREPLSVTPFTRFEQLRHLHVSGRVTDVDSLEAMRDLRMLGFDRGGTDAVLPLQDTAVEHLNLYGPRFKPALVTLPRTLRFLTIDRLGDIPSLTPWQVPPTLRRLDMHGRTIIRDDSLDTLVDQGTWVIAEEGKTLYSKRVQDVTWTPTPEHLCPPPPDFYGYWGEHSWRP